jgi:predicted Zn-dependent peptidase
LRTRPKEALDFLLWLESDRMGHLLGAVTQAKLDEQRGVVQNEKRQGENRPYAIAEELIHKGTYPASHPYSWTVIGSKEDLNAASLDDVNEWFRKYYGAANATLVVAGACRGWICRRITTVTTPARILGLKQGDVDAAARNVVHPNQRVWVVVGDRARIEAGIRELGLGKVHVINPDNTAGEVASNGHQAQAAHALAAVLGSAPRTFPKGQ